MNSRSWSAATVPSAIPSNSDARCWAAPS